MKKASKLVANSTLQLAFFKTCYLFFTRFFLRGEGTIRQHFKIYRIFLHSLYVCKYYIDMILCSNSEKEFDFS